jgi:hypothetical protein
MLRECVELCPDELWAGRDAPRDYWKMAYHAAFFGDLYSGQNEAAFKPWSKHSEDALEIEKDVPAAEPLTKADVVAYIDDLIGRVDATVDGLDLDTSDSGFHWYPNITKLEHELLSIRHIQGHVGQLSERLFAAGIESSWISRRA